MFKFSTMSHRTTRRSFLSHTILATAAYTTALVPITHAIEPFKRTGKPKLMMSLAGYSFREFFKEGRGTNPKTDPAKRIDMLQFVDYCAEQDCAAEVTSYYFPAKVTDDYLLNLKRHAFLRGVALSGTAVGNTFTHPPGAKRDTEIASVKEWVDHAAVMGAPHIRVFAGEPQKTSKEEAKKLCIEALEECGDYAGKKGIVLGIENHGGIIGNAADLLEIMRAVKSPWCGVNLDSGNFRTDDPYRDFAACAPYAVNVQWKAEVFPAGGQKQPADLKRIVKILRDANYQGYMALEYEAAEDPWTAVPRLLNEMRGLIGG
jgi:sugar phosphate isomerase/epimerase